MTSLYKKLLASSSWSLLFLVGLAFILRLPLLNGSLWLDEAAQAIESSRPFSQQLQIVDDFQPPLLHYLTFFSIHFGQAFGLGQNEAWLRFWGALLPGLVTVVMTYLLGKKLFNKKVAFFAGLLLTTSSYHIFFSQELRPYSLPIPFALLSTYSLLNFNKKKNAHFFFALWSVLGLYSSYLYPFLLIAQALYLFRLWRSGEERIFIRSLISLVLIVLAFLPWLPFFLGQLQAGQALRGNLTGWENVVGSSQIKSLLLVPLKFLFGVSDLEFNFYYLASLALAVILSILLLAKNWLASKKQNSFLMIVYFLILPLLVSWLVSFLVPVLQPKRVLYLLPFFYLAVAYLACNLRSKLGQALIILLLLINILSLKNYWQNPKLQREDWRGLISEINHKFPIKNSIAVFAFTEPFAPWRYYQKEDFATLSTETYDLRTVENPAEEFKSLANYDYVLLFDYLRDLSDPGNQLPDIIRNLGYSETSYLDYPNIGFVRVYTKDSKQNLADIQKENNENWN